MTSFDKTLRSLMQAANISSYRALADRAQVSRWQVKQLRTGQVRKMRVGVLMALADALQISLPELLMQADADAPAQFSPVQRSNIQLAEKGMQTDLKEGTVSTARLATLQDEYRRLQAQMEAQTEQVRLQLQQEVLRSLESWLIQWPTIVARAQARKDLAAVKVLPFVRPVEQLIADWGVEAIASVDAQVAYDPQIHQLVGGSVKPGNQVRVTHIGYKYRGKLLYRAKVKPV